VEYGGNNITHWSFLDDEGVNVERLCAKLILISDEDKEKDDRHAKLAQSLGERFFKLPVRESENLLTPEIIRQIIISYEGESVELNEFKETQYGANCLGRFIDEKVLKDKAKSKRYRRNGNQTCYMDSSGTVKDKLEFCRRALMHIVSVQDMSQNAILLASKICDFIQAENKL
jgi:hypothetical protein